MQQREGLTYWNWDELKPTEQYEISRGFLKFLGIRDMEESLWRFDPHAINDLGRRGAWKALIESNPPANRLSPVR